jgi:tRNA (guanine37-N1)-methyltransferase
MKELFRADILSAIPESFDSVLNTSILKRATEREIANLNIHNLHDYASDQFGHIDDYPYGGGAGMLIKCKPVFDCVEGLQAERQYDEIIYMSADGERLTQSIANELSLKRNIMVICGHYKGIDQRIRDSLVTREISVGDFVLTGGELPALILIDSIVRLLPGVMSDINSALKDSFMDGLLEPPQYTRPAEFMGMKVPEVLMSGNDAEIVKWQDEQALEKTKQRRPDLYELYTKDI